jgi:predicted nuclease of predicted toxin-antitoxin system
MRLLLKDFGNLAVVQGRPHAGIVRLVNFAARQQASACLYVLEKYGTELMAGAMVTAEPGRIRFRPPPLPASFDNGEA